MVSTEVLQPQDVDGGVTKQPPVAHPQGSAVPLHPVSGPCAWEAKDYSDPESYTTRLSASEVDELVSAVAAAEAKVDEREDKRIERAISKKEDFPLPTLGPKLVALADEAKNGRGFALIKGFPVDKLTRRQTVIAYWGCGLFWGNARPNNKKGHLVGHIKDLGADPSLPTTRLYATSAAQPWHNDSADLVSLLCLARAGRGGGESGWSSSIAVYNEVLRLNSKAAESLSAPSAWFYDRKNEVPSGKKPFFEIPVANFYKGFLSLNFSANYFRDSQRFDEVPRLTEDQLEGIRLVEELAASPRFALKYDLQPGDVQLLSNHTVFHSRGAFENGSTPEEQRHLLRLWISPEDDRPLPGVYEEIYGGTVELGKRGGIRIDGEMLREEDLHISLEAE